MFFANRVFSIAVFSVIAMALSDCTTVQVNEQSLANLSFNGVIEGGANVQLKNGHWQGKPVEPGSATAPTVDIAPNFLIKGDLNGDGKDEYVVLLISWTGGSGVFSTAAVVSNDAGKLQHIGGAFLGDRVQIISANIQNQKLMLDMIETGPEDAACCPSQRSQKAYVWQQGQLQLKPELGKSGKATINVLGENDWQLTTWNNGEFVNPDVHITMSYADGKVTGHSACNRYFAGVKPGDTFGNIQVSAVGATRMACTEELMHSEDKYHGILAKVNRYWFMAGYLYVNYALDDSMSNMGTLIFQPVSKDSQHN